jgi:hypothetical protein
MTETSTTGGSAKVTKIQAATATPKYPSLTAALVAFQADIPTPAKDAVNPAFKSNFASLDGITPLLTSKLSEVGIAWSARGGYEGDQYGVLGSLRHESGEVLEGFFPVPNLNKPQDIGSAFTYARRYLLLALTGVAPTGEDDDGQKAQDAAVQKELQVAQAQQAAAAVDVITPLKKRIAELLTEAGELTEDMDQDARTAKVKSLGDAFFGRAGWANSDIALTKWIKALEGPEADPQTGEVKS